MTGIDASDLGDEFAGREHSRRNTNVKFIHGLSAEIPSESFDQIVCSDVIEHVADPGGLIGEI